MHSRWQPTSDNAGTTTSGSRPLIRTASTIGTTKSSSLLVACACVINFHIAPATKRNKRPRRRARAPPSLARQRRQPIGARWPPGPSKLFRTKRRAGYAHLSFDWFGSGRKVKQFRTSPASGGAQWRARLIVRLVARLIACPINTCQLSRRARAISRQ